MEEEKIKSIEDQFYRKYNGNFHHIFNCKQEWTMAFLEINAHNCMWDKA